MCARHVWHVVRHKTIQYLIIVLFTMALFTNVFILLAKFADDKESEGSELLHARVPRVLSHGVTRKPRTSVSRLIIVSQTEKRQNIESLYAIKPEQFMRRNVPSLSRDTRNVHSTPIISRTCQELCVRDVSPPYKLSAVLLVRVYREDLAGLSSREMLQWLFYLRYAGFDHVFVYDAYVSKNESQYHVLLPLIRSGYVTYVDWSAHNPYRIKETQISAYQHCIDKNRGNITWHMAIDIDEYPFSSVDLEFNFMRRFLQKFFAENPHVSQVTLQNYLFLGKPLDPRSNPFLIARLRRRTHKKANDLGKSVFRVAQVLAAQVHHNDMREGRTIDSDAKTMRLNHYWGARLQDWGEDTPRILDITEADYSVKPIVDQLERCSEYFGGGSLYRQRWN